MLILDQPINGELEFSQELTSLLNRYGWDTKLQTPDFIISEQLLFALHAQEELQSKREAWHGREWRPSEANVQGAQC